MTNEEGKAGTASTSLIVNKVPPLFTAADMSLSEPVATGGDTITLNGQFTDPGTLETHTVTINWGDGSAPTVLLELLGQVVASTTPGLYTFSAAHQYLNNPPGEPAESTDDIHVSVSDAVSATSADKSIMVKNATPTVRIESAGNLGSGTIALTALVTNPGVSGSETLAWTLTQNGIVIATATTPTFTFAVPDPIGVLVAAATATDIDGGTGSDSAQIVVIPQSDSSVLITPAGISISTGGGPVSIIPTAGANEVLAEIDGSNDRVDASATTDPVELDGYGGNETLKGGAGNDLLVAGPGATAWSPAPAKTRWSQIRVTTRSSAAPVTISSSSILVPTPSWWAVPRKHPRLLDLLRRGCDQPQSGKRTNTVRRLERRSRVRRDPRGQF